MSVLPILRYPAPELRRVCEPIERFDSGLLALVVDMVETMKSHRALGLAAPQIGACVRVITIDVTGRWLVLVNPTVKVSGHKVLAEEGCLSLPDYREIIPRWSACTVTARDHQGGALSIDCTDLLARVVQHEYDHLEGGLICDRTDGVQRRGRAERYLRECGT